MHSLPEFCIGIGQGKSWVDCVRVRVDEVRVDEIRVHEVRVTSE